MAVPGETSSEFAQGTRPLFLNFERVRHDELPTFSAYISYSYNDFPTVLVFGRSRSQFSLRFMKRPLQVLQQRR
jgi:hypothetical protein